MLIEYDGSYPNLCSGGLVITIDGKRWAFPSYCMSSGGRVWFDNDWRDYIEHGPWSIREWPEGFPEDLKEEVVKEVNYQIPWGCCGGCI